MAEYIEREKAFKLIKEQKEKETGAYSKGRNKGLTIAGSIINNKEALSTADVVEVKHGKWKNSGDCDWRCTNCNEYFTLDIDMHPIDDCGMYHCPNCGAKMDLKAEPNFCTDKQNNLVHCESCHEECKSKELRE